MKICLAQIKPNPGDIPRNIERHRQFIISAAAGGSDAIFFPELSLSGYEPKLANDLATDLADHRFDQFQILSDVHDIAIGIGMPIRVGFGIQIGMIIMKANHPRQIYYKQFLHSDELPYFIGGQEDVLLDFDEIKLAPAICYESLLSEHAEKAFNRGANLYVASVAKPMRGLEKAETHYPLIAKRYCMPVLMSNCVGPSDDFLSVGKTGAWNNQGILVGQLDQENEGLLIFDTQTQKATTRQL